MSHIVNKRGWQHQFNEQGNDDRTAQGFLLVTHVFQNRSHISSMSTNPRFPRSKKFLKCKCTEKNCQAELAKHITRHMPTNFRDKANFPYMHFFTSRNSMEGVILKSMLVLVQILHFSAPLYIEICHN